MSDFYKALVIALIGNCFKLFKFSAGIASSHWPFSKPNERPLHIHQLSNHPLVIKEQRPQMLAARLSQLSCDNKEFSKVPDYMDALNQSGHTDKLEYADIFGSKKKKRKRNITWFNTPFNEHVKTNIGKEFFRLLTKHYPLHHRLHKFCNKFNVKVSYSCMPNMAAIITKNNKLYYLTGLLQIALHHRAIVETNPVVHYKENTTNPLLSTYIACPILGNATSNYYGCCETEFKAHFYNHNQSFKYHRNRNATKHSKAFWKAKDARKKPGIK